MKSYSIFTILLLCLAILIVDILAFYWLLSITDFMVSKIIRTIIYAAFWFFSIGLTLSILILKIRLENMEPRRKQLLVSFLYGLTVLSFMPKLVFVIIISILYFTNHVFSATESLIVVPVVGLISGFLPFFVIIYGIFRSLYRFKVYHINIGLEKLPKRFDGLRIVQISDLHLGSFNYRYHIFNRAVKLINHLKADYIFITGDLINNYAWELRGWERVLKQFHSNKGKYAILGNHDYGDYSVWKSAVEKENNLQEIKIFYKKIGFKLLLNDADTITRKNENIAILGVENWGKPPFKQYGDLNKTINKVSTIPFKILLSHDPSHWVEEVIDKTDIAITLSGHTHGMQAAIGLKGRKWSPIKYKYQHWAGLYRHGDQYLYVNRGLGWLGFPGRLGMRPEITSIDLFRTV